MARYLSLLQFLGEIWIIGNDYIAALLPEMERLVKDEDRMGSAVSSCRSNSGRWRHGFLKH